MEGRDVAILRHIGLYRLTLRTVLDRVFFNGVPPGDVLQRLRDAGDIVTRKLPGNTSYYQLSNQGVNLIGVPADRATPFGPNALLTHLAILWFCTMDGVERYRAEPSHLEGNGIPIDALTGDHCVEIGGQGRGRILQVYVPGTRTSPDRIRRRLRDSLNRALDNATARALIEDRQYGFAVLVDLDTKRKHVRDIVARTRLGRHPLQHWAHFQVNLAPSPATLRMYTAGTRRNSDGT
ncbi:MAG: hypothetical protein KJZ54_02035 [Phycisphaerales bacterium]|nr:hypothetical protein [Phycisphaerales bacterium]